MTQVRSNLLLNLFSAPRDTWFGHSSCAEKTRKSYARQEDVEEICDKPTVVALLPPTLVPMSPSEVEDVAT